MSENDIERLVYLFSKLPGLGARSARRVVFHLLKNKEFQMIPLAENILSAAKNIKNCDICGNLDTISPCQICSLDNRDDQQICVVETASDLWVFERSKIFKGRYHVLGGVLSAIEGKTPSDLNIESLVQRVAEQGFEEVIIATNATMEGQTTAHYISERLKTYPVKITRLAFGMPVGGELDYLDEGTLGAALKSRVTC